LDGVPPSGASIGSSSGLFNWTPTTNQGPANYNITVRVTDNGSPQLSDTETFTIAVLKLPRVSTVQFSNSIVTLAWESYPGRRYKIETTSGLENPVWTQVGSDIFATGTTQVFSYSPTPGQQRFYRIISFDF